MSDTPTKECGQGAITSNWLNRPNCPGSPYIPSKTGSKYIRIESSSSVEMNEGNQEACAKSLETTHQGARRAAGPLTSRRSSRTSISVRAAN